MKTKVLLTGLIALGLSHAASAGTIVGATSVTSNTEWGSNYSVSHLIDQSGLSASYTSGVTDFDSFTASTTHTTVAPNFEWFAANGTYQDTLIFDLGSALSINKIAVWNEESWGTDSVTISYATDSLFSDEVTLGSFALTDHPLSQDYVADVLSFNFVTAQFFKFNVFGSTGDAVALGEVAFSSVPGVSEVPVPAAAFLFGPALLGMVGLRRKSKQA